MFVLNFVDVCMVDMSEIDKNGCFILLVEVVMYKFCKMIGIIIDEEEWNFVVLDKYLIMYFVVVDDDGNVIVKNDSLYELK